MFSCGFLLWFNYTLWIHRLHRFRSCVYLATEFSFQMHMVWKTGAVFWCWKMELIYGASFSSICHGHNVLTCCCYYYLSVTNQSVKLCRISSIESEIRLYWTQLISPIDLRVAAVQKHDPTWGWNRPQVDRRRLGHIRLDLTWLDSGMW